MQLFHLIPPLGSYFNFLLSMKPLRLSKNTIGNCALLLLTLGGCGGDTASRTPAPDTEPINKVINTSNIDESFAIYLLYRYRMDKELPKLMEFKLLYRGADEGIMDCPIKGTIERKGPLIESAYIFNACQKDVGTVLHGISSQRISVGTAKTSWDTFSDFVYQLNEDNDTQKLDGNYTFPNNIPGKATRSTDFQLTYVHGDRTTTYFTQYSASIEITSSLLGNRQHFVLTDYTSNWTPISPLLQADDGSNLTIKEDPSNVVNVELRNEVAGKIIKSKIYTVDEVNSLLNKVRKTKT